MLHDIVLVVIRGVVKENADTRKIRNTMISEAGMEHRYVRPHRLIHKQDPGVLHYMLCIVIIFIIIIIMAVFIIYFLYTCS